MRRSRIRIRPGLAAGCAAWLLAVASGGAFAEEKSPPEVAAEAAAERTEEIVFSFGKDVRAAPRRILDDLLGLAEPTNLGILAVSGGLTAVSTQEWDENVRDEVTDEPQRFGRRMNHLLENSGETYNHLAAAAALYGTSLLLQSPTLHELSLDALHAMTIQIPLTQGLKQAFSTRRPNGGKNGLPSGHVSSTFTLAAVAHENLGLVPGLLGYAWGSLVALHRIDAGHHDLSDTILGAGLGVAIGFASAGNGAPRLAGMEVKPWVDPRRGAKGVGLEYRFESRGLTGSLRAEAARTGRPARRGEDASRRAIVAEGARPGGACRLSGLATGGRRRSSASFASSPRCARERERRA